MGGKEGRGNGEFEEGRGVVGLWIVGMIDEFVMGC